MRGIDALSNDPNTTMVRIDELFQAQRYLFYVKRPHVKNAETFRANFVRVIVNTLIVSHFSDTSSGIVEEGEHAMPLEWIVRIETLEETVDMDPSFARFPSEILLQIDNWMT